MISSSSTTLTAYIRTKALELGFSKVGFARAEPMPDEGRRLDEWLGRGFHGTMSWMQRNADQRRDPSLVLPGALSVISLALNYYFPAERDDNPSSGKISRYAWGDDYHVVMTPRIQSLVDCIKSERPECHSKLYVDTGPLMDKAWAVRSGIGWLGKHTNVITKEYGSWVFLGEILLDVELEYDRSIADFCGSCTACIDACPTDAIVEPYVLDATRCISYLTIEHKGDIPEELKPQLANWVYGCDICQDVCPWNRFQQPTTIDAFSPRKDNLNPDLHALESISAEKFTEQFRRSPIKRTKREGIVRNARAVRDGKRLRAQEDSINS